MSRPVVNGVVHIFVISDLKQCWCTEHSSNGIITWESQIEFCNPKHSTLFVEVSVVLLQRMNVEQLSSEWIRLCHQIMATR